jgi:hypothetical protein
MIWAGNKECSTEKSTLVTSEWKLGGGGFLTSNDSYKPTTYKKQI